MFYFMIESASFQTTVYKKRYLKENPVRGRSVGTVETSLRGRVGEVLHNRLSDQLDVYDVVTLTSGGNKKTCTEPHKLDYLVGSSVLM